MNLLPPTTEYSTVCSATFAKCRSSEHARQPNVPGRKQSRQREQWCVGAAGARGGSYGEWGGVGRWSAVRLRLRGAAVASFFCLPLTPSRPRSINSGNQRSARMSTPVPEPRQTSYLVIMENPCRREAARRPNRNVQQTCQRRGPAHRRMEQCRLVQYRYRARRARRVPNVAPSSQVVTIQRSRIRSANRNGTEWIKKG